MQKNQAEKFGALIISNDNIDELLEDIHRRDKFNIVFGIEDDDVSKHNSSNSGKSEDTNED